MSTTAESPRIRVVRRGVNPLHGLLLAGTFPLYLTAALSDYAYATSYHIQWSTFASWSIAGGLVFNGLAWLFALGGIVMASGQRGRAALECLLLLVTFVLGFVNALVHARDAWAMMPTGFVLSIVIALLSLVAALIGLSRNRAIAQEMAGGRS
ncbi:hypothetical protein EVC62_11380 [Salinicola endophyticus]|uniref:DUF2231 domain-containing protein n=1 Tax=Salinicola endophyticus TaxID=1949083 RepID=A0ABY8FMW7_9GAMM|nr:MULTISPECIES: DUF2231 domain-containing protein [Salinicola]WFF42056.1 hypothetical protein EVC62_11380 [Salinicola endophyticus]